MRVVQDATGGLKNAGRLERRRADGALGEAASREMQDEERKAMMEMYAATSAAVNYGAKKNETEGPEVMRLGR